MAVSKRLRFEILRRDNHTCRYCGGSAPDKVLTVDHVVAVALGGSDEPSNLAAACKDCNGGKSASSPDAPLVAQVAEAAIQWAAALELVANERAAARKQSKKHYTQFDKEWLQWKSQAGKPVARPQSWRTTVDQVLNAGLCIDDLVELTRVAMESRADDVWRYFCGCCWTRVRQTQERAREIVGDAGRAEPAGVELTTRWTTAEIEDLMSSAHGYASRNITQESIDSAHCRHREWGEGDCGDILCRISRAESLGWMADRGYIQKMRDLALMDELDGLDAPDEREFVDA